MSENGANDQELITKVWDENRLLIKPTKGQDVLYYHLKLLKEINNSSILLPRLLNAYEPALLLYDLSHRNLIKLSETQTSFQILLKVLNEYCQLRLSMDASLLDYRLIQLSEELIFLSGQEGEKEDGLCFIYLPLRQTHEENELEDRHAEELSRLLEKTILASQSEAVLSAEEMATWIHSSYSDFPKFRSTCSELFEKYGVTKNKDRFKHTDRFKNTDKKKINTLNPKTNQAGLFVALILFCLLLANLFMQEKIIPENLGSKILSFAFLCAAVVGAAMAIFHPRSPFQLNKSRFQKEREGNLAEELNAAPHKDSKLDFDTKENRKESDTFYPAYLLRLSSHHSKTLRPVQDIAKAEVEAFIFSTPLKLGASKTKANYSLAYKAEAAWHSSLSSDEEGAWLDYVDEDTDIFIDEKRCEKLGRYALPTHCLLRFGPAVREFYRED